MSTYADILTDYFKRKLSKIPDFDVNDVLAYHQTVGKKFYSVHIRIEGGVPSVISTAPGYGANNNNFIKFIKSCCQTHDISDCEVFACLKDTYRGLHNNSYPLFFRFASGHDNCFPYMDTLASEITGFIKKPELSLPERNGLILFRGANSGWARKMVRTPIVKSGELVTVCKADFKYTSSRGNPLLKSRKPKNFVSFSKQQDYSFIVSARGQGCWRNSDLVTLGLGAVPVFVRHEDDYDSFLTPLLVSGETHVDVSWDEDPKVLASRFDDMYQDYLDNPVKYQGIADRARSIYEFLENNDRLNMRRVFSNNLNLYAERFFQ